MNLLAPAPLKQASSASLLTTATPPTTPFSNPRVLTCLVVSLLKANCNLHFLSSLSSTFVKDRWILDEEASETTSAIAMWPKRTYKLTSDDEFNSKKDDVDIGMALIHAFHPENPNSYLGDAKYLRTDHETLYAACPFSKVIQNGTEWIGLCMSVLETKDEAKWTFHDIIPIQSNQWETTNAWYDTEAQADAAWESEIRSEVHEFPSTKVIPPTPLMQGPMETNPPLFQDTLNRLSPSNGTIRRKSPDAEYWDSYGLTFREETMSRNRQIARSKEVGYEVPADDNEEDDYWDSYG